MIVCPLIALVVLGIAYYKIHKRSSKLETGLPGALGYGFLGYLWQYLILWHLYLKEYPGLARSVCLLD